MGSSHQLVRWSGIEDVTIALRLRAPPPDYPPHAFAGDPNAARESDRAVIAQPGPVDPAVSPQRPRSGSSRRQKKWLGHSGRTARPRWGTSLLRSCRCRLTNEGEPAPMRRAPKASSAASGAGAHGAAALKVAVGRIEHSTEAGEAPSDDSATSRPPEIRRATATVGRAHDLGSRGESVPTPASCPGQGPPRLWLDRGCRSSDDRSPSCPRCR